MDDKGNIRSFATPEEARGAGFHHALPPKFDSLKILEDALRRSELGNPEEALVLKMHRVDDRPLVLTLRDPEREENRTPAVCGTRCPSIKSRFKRRR